MSLAIRQAVLTPERVGALLASIPERFRPTHFGIRRQRTRGRGVEIADRKRLREYIESNQIYWFHGDETLLVIMACTDEPGDIKVYPYPSEPDCKWFIPWLGHFCRGDILYGYAAMAEEIEHRHAYAVPYVEPNSGAACGWLGRNYDRYVPGLYWLNVFPHEYIARHALDIAGLAARTGGNVIEFVWGVVLQLYESPESWAENADRIDEIIYDTPGFFSKRRVDIPATIHLRDTIRLIKELGEAWP